MKVFGKISRSNLLRVVFPLEELPLMPTMMAFFSAATISAVINSVSMTWSLDLISVTDSKLSRWSLLQILHNYILTARCLEAGSEFWGKLSQQCSQ
jgi:hypothetical protein